MLENINLKLEDFEEAYSRVSPGKFLNYQDCKLKKDTWGNDEYIGMILKKEEKNINGEPNWHGFKQGYQKENERFGIVSCFDDEDHGLNLWVYKDHVEVAVFQKQIQVWGMSFDRLGNIRQKWGEKQSMFRDWKAIRFIKENYVSTSRKFKKF